jgi:L-ascorbate metabolism protein UlaG (beta-lactamase superfamily)
MPTEIKYLGHSSFQILTNNKSILIDPFLTDNPTATTTADEIDADVILVTHGHFDHVADVEAIAKRTGALLIANYEIVTWFQNQGIENAHPMHIGGQHEFDFGTVKLTIAHHGSCLPDGSNGGNPAGILLKSADGTIYHAGDTGLFLDMQLIAEEDIQVAILPIGDNFTMGPADSVTATGFLKAGTVIPSHFNTWPLIEQDTDAWQDAIRSHTSAQPVVLSPGESFLLEKK